MPEKILIVDDEKDIVYVIRTALEREGFEVIEATNGLRGLERVAQDKPDLIVLDIMMPGMDGFEVMQRLKADSTTASIPVLMLTAKTQIEDELSGWQAGVEFYLTKPFDLDELVTYVHIMLDERTMNE